MNTDPVHDVVTCTLSLTLVGLGSALTVGLFLLSLFWVVRGMMSNRADPPLRVIAP